MAAAIAEFDLALRRFALGERTHCSTGRANRINRTAGRCHAVQRCRAIILAVACRMRLVNRVRDRINHRRLDREREPALPDFVRFVVVRSIDGRINRDVLACAREILAGDKIAAGHTQVFTRRDVQVAVERPDRAAVAGHACVVGRVRLRLAANGNTHAAACAEPGFVFAVVRLRILRVLRRGDGHVTGRNKVHVIRTHDGRALHGEVPACVDVDALARDRASHRDIRLRTLRLVRGGSVEGTAATGFDRRGTVVFFACLADIDVASCDHVSRTRGRRE